MAIRSGGTKVEHVQQDVVAVVLPLLESCNRALDQSLRIVQSLRRNKRTVEVIASQEDAEVVRKRLPPSVKVHTATTATLMFGESDDHTHSMKVAEAAPQYFSAIHAVSTAGALSIASVLRRQGLGFTRSRIVSHDVGGRIWAHSVAGIAPGHDEVAADHLEKLQHKFADSVVLHSESQPPNPASLERPIAADSQLLFDQPLWCGLGELSIDQLQLPATHPRVHVCLVHHERPEKLKIALTSLAAQTYDNFTVTVVDDGSLCRGSVEYRSAMQFAEDKGWRVVEQDNRYLGAARNNATKGVDADYLLFMDDDNVAEPEEIETLVSVAIRTGSDFLTTYAKGFEGEDAPKSVWAVLGPLGAAESLGWLSNTCGDANALVRKESFEQLGGFVENYGVTHEDWELFMRAHLEGFSVEFVPVPLFWYRIDPNGMFRGGELRRSLDLAVSIRPYIEKRSFRYGLVSQLAQGVFALASSGPGVHVGGPLHGSEALCSTFQPENQALPAARVAIICRTKDRPLLLRRAIESVCAQTYGDWLLVIVNDGGEPAAVDDLVAEYRPQLLGRATVVHNGLSVGMQAASNMGMTESASEFAAIHDDDDTWEPGFLASCVEVLAASSSNVGAVVTHITTIVERILEGGEIERLNSFPHRGHDLLAVSLRDLAVENRFPPIGMLFKRSSYEAVGRFCNDDGPLGDWTFHLGLAQKFEIAVVEKSLANYHQRRGGSDAAYNNSVTSGQRSHIVKRASIVTRAARQHKSKVNHHLVLGDVQYDLERHLTGSVESFSSVFDELMDNVGTLSESQPSGSVNGIPDAAFLDLPSGEIALPREGFAVLGESLIWSTDRTSDSHQLSIIEPTNSGIQGCESRVARFSYSPEVADESGYVRIGFRTRSAAFGAGGVASFHCLARSRQTLDIAISGFSRPNNETRSEMGELELATLENEWQGIGLTRVVPDVIPKEMDSKHFLQFNLHLPVDRPYVLDVALPQFRTGGTPSVFVH